MRTLRVAFETVPVARWGSLFHVLLLEQPDIQLEWIAMPFPRPDRPLLHGADVGLFLEPPLDPTLRSLVVDTSRMAVLMAVGHPLAHHHELRVAEVLDEPFPDGDGAHPAWRAFWTLEPQRGGPPPARAAAENNASVACTAESSFVSCSMRAVIKRPASSAIRIV